MKLSLTMNMPSHKGGPVHQIICEHPAKTLAEFSKIISENDYITVTEYYHEASPTGNGKMKRIGELLISCMYIGKVKETTFQT